MNHAENPANDGAMLPDRFNSTSSPCLQEYYTTRLENVRRHLPEAGRQPKEIGVVCVEVHYDGCSDSGQIESLHYFDVDFKPIDLGNHFRQQTSDWLMHLFYDLIGVRHSGWRTTTGP